MVTGASSVSVSNSKPAHTDSFQGHKKSLITDFTAAQISNPSHSTSLSYKQREISDRGLEIVRHK